MHQTICVSYCSSLPANVTPGPAQRERTHCVTRHALSLDCSLACSGQQLSGPHPHPPTLPPTVTHGHHSLSVPHGWAGAGVVALASPCWCWRLLVLVCGDQLSVQCPVSSQRQRSYSDICCPCAVPVCPPCTATLRHYLPCCDVTPVSLSSVQCPQCPLPDTAS